MIWVIYAGFFAAGFLVGAWWIRMGLPYESGSGE